MKPIFVRATFIEDRRRRDTLALGAALDAALRDLAGTRGRADVWYDKKFIWEYQGKHANLDKAYQQLLLYRESLGNPPLLITSASNSMENCSPSSKTTPVRFQTP